MSKQPNLNHPPIAVGRGIDFPDRGNKIPFAGTMATNDGGHLRDGQLISRANK